MFDFEKKIYHVLMRYFSFRKELEINKGNQGIAGVTVLPYQTGEGCWFLVQVRMVCVLVLKPWCPVSGY